MSRKTKINNVKDLTEDLNDVYESLRKGELSLAQAATAANVAGKIMSIQKTTIDYNKQTGKADKAIEFMEYQ